MKNILLTFDVEEFDYPREVGLGISDKEMHSISYKGTKEILKLLNKYKITATFFITANFAQKYPKMIRDISKKHEVASHGYLHSHDYKTMNKNKAVFYIRKSKEALEKITGKRVYGFRAPKFQAPKYSALEGIFEYDSSINPTYIPGRYNNFFKRRIIHKRGDLIIVPASVTPVIRLPLFWIAFRNFGLGYGKFCTRACFLSGDYVNLLFHPWEFTDVSRFRKLGLAVKGTGNRLISMLDEYITWAKKNKYKFDTIHNYLNIKI